MNVVLQDLFFSFRDSAFDRDYLKSGPAEDCTLVNAFDVWLKDLDLTSSGPEWSAAQVPNFETWLMLFIYATENLDAELKAILKYGSVGWQGYSEETAHLYTEEPPKGANTILRHGSESDKHTMLEHPIFDRNYFEYYMTQHRAAKA